MRTVSLSQAAGGLLLLATGAQAATIQPRDTTIIVSDEVFGTPGEPAIYTPPSSGRCPPFNRGTFAIDAYQLYPENMDWDSKLCQVYIGILFNASFGIYDPYADALSVIEFPGYTRHSAFHVGGVAYDPYSGLTSVILGQGNAFNTAGAQIAGDNFFKKFDPRTRKFLWSLNATAVSQGRYGGFNDVTHDVHGNSFFVGTFPSSILKVDPAGTTIEEWYLPPTIDHTIRGYSGIALVEDTIMVLDSGTGQLFRFDATAEKGTPIPVPHTPNTPIPGGDSIRLPPKFGGRIMLAADHVRGVAVLRSKDAKWTEAEYLGLIPNPPGLPAGVLIVSTTQIGDKLYIVNDWFADPWVPGTVAGNKTTFPMIEITHQVNALLCNAGRTKRSAELAWSG
ncbi:hypothetical protein B0T22DRAFT_162482 [Podospora appendiculata]|uniref:Uncharacterized protein n=1 Tax=Podospora appendiculata TaxID=314037 RepID=A0AAE1CCS7_9PEZI|nr:hypothetical protein B0T22DRAFT_162482 [Podospora appendiculata]